MATTSATQSSTIAAPDHSNGNVVSGNANGSVHPQLAQPSPPNPRLTSRKYRHVAAVHSKVRTSSLSSDSMESPSFLGFRNLMVLVLSMSMGLAKRKFLAEQCFSCNEFTTCCGELHEGSHPLIMLRLSHTHSLRSMAFSSAYDATTISAKISFSAQSSTPSSHAISF